METVTIPQNEYLNLISLYLKIKQQIGVITQYKTEEELLKDFYDNKLELSEKAFANGEIIEHNELKKEVEQWKSQRK